MTDYVATETHRITAGDREISVEHATLAIIELNDELAEATGVDLVSIAAAAIDADGVRRIVRELGLTGRAYVKIVENRSYLVLRGYPGLRPTLTGTRYLATNPKVAHMVISPTNLAQAAARATGIAIIAYAALRIVEFVLRDDDGRLAHLLGTLATDIVRFAIAAGFGFLAAALVGTVTTVVAAPLIAGIMVSVAVGMALDRLDRRFGITESLVEAIQTRLDQMQSPFGYLAREIHRWERYMIDRAVQRQIWRQRF